MTLEQVMHAIKAACDVSGDTEIWIYGSQAVLGNIADPPEAVTTSMEIDVEPVNFPEAVTKIDGALGEGSPFHSLHGFYVHGVAMKDLVVLPPGWQERVRIIPEPLTNGKFKGRCLELHDIAVSKLAAFRPQDLAYVRTLMLEALIDEQHLRERLQATQFDGTLKERCLDWFEKTLLLIGD